METCSGYVVQGAEAAGAEGPLRDTGPEYRVYLKHCRILIIDGEVLPVAEWAERKGIPADVILGRLFRGVPDRLAVEIPWRPHQRRIKRMRTRQSRP